MQSTAISVTDYLDSMPAERQEAVKRIRDVLLRHMPEGFQETISYGMITYCVPHSTYPSGYHCNPEQALPFLSVASRKNFVALYHMGVYADTSLLDWFTAEYPKHCKTKLDMGKSCIRFKKMEDIPYVLIGELAGKMTPQQWIARYEAVLQQSRPRK